MVGILAPAHDLAAANGEHHPVCGDLGRDATVPSPLALVAEQRHDVVTRVPQILDLELDVLPRRQPASPKGPNALVAAVHARYVGDRLLYSRGVPFDLRIVEVECSLVIAPPKGLNQVANELDVLLRHRPA
jgi:hypothetical protein